MEGGGIVKIKCPSCGYENIQGSDRCEDCLYTLMQRDIPRPRKDDSIQSAMMTTPVAALLTGKDLLVATPDDSVQKVIRIFQKQQKNCVLIYDHHRLAGILSNRDILRRVAGQYEDLGNVKLKEVMTPNPETVRAADPIAVAVNKMSAGGYRHVPVLDADGRPLSIITIRDVLAFLAKRNHLEAGA